MTTTQAVKIALECIRMRMRYFNPQANLHERYNLDTPSAINASRERARLWEAADILKAMIDPTDRLPLWMLNRQSEIKNQKSK